MNRSLCLMSLVAVFPPTAMSFLPPTFRNNDWRVSSSTFHLSAAKKQSPSGQGFGKTAPEKTKTSSSPYREEASEDTSSTTPLQSIETGASDAIPTVVSSTALDSADASSLPPEERAKQVLREKYGLKTLEEQQTDQKKREQMEESRKKRQEWKQMAEKEDFDIMAIVPAPVLVALDRFLKAGVGICTLLFVSAGLGITAEAWSKASGNPLPDDVDAFIVNVIEPNFTPGLLVLLGFSVSLGVLSALQLGSAGATYREDK